MTQQQQRLQLYQQSIFKELRKVVPGYFDDRSENWYVNLCTQDKIWISQNRQKFLFTIEKFDNARLPKEKKELREELIDLVKEILPKCKKLKEKAADNEKKSFEEMTSQLRKKRRTDGGEVDNDYEEDYYDHDDYLPNLAPMQKERKPESNVKKPEKKQEEKSNNNNNQDVPMMWTPSFAGPSSTTVITSTTRPVELTRPISEVNDITYDISDILTKNLLYDLRDLISKYGCRDRILKAIKGLKSEKTNREALIGFDNILTLRLDKVS